MRKLVRDKLPEFLEGEGTHVSFGTADEMERIPLLWSKLLEESAELMVAGGDRENVLKELGDLMEVIWALADAYGISIMEVTTQAALKQRERGSFNDLRTMTIELGSAPKQVVVNEKIAVKYSPPSRRHSDMEHLPPDYRGAVYSG